METQKRKYTANSQKPWLVKAMTGQTSSTAYDSTMLSVVYELSIFKKKLVSC